MATEDATNPEELDTAADTGGEAQDTEGVDEARAAETDDTGDEVDASGEDQDEAGEEEFVEVEHEGKTYKAPAALKDAFLRHADYTRKTQELAEQRRSAEATLERHAQALSEREQAIAQRDEQYAATEENLLNVRSEIRTLDHSIAAYDALVQRAEDDGDVDRARDLKFERQEVRDNKRELELQIQPLKDQLDGHRQRAGQAAEQERQVAIRRGFHALVNTHGLTEQTYNDVASHMTTQFGISPQEVYGAAADPRMILVAKAAFDSVGLAAENERLKTEIAALKKGKTAQDGRPAATVGTKTPAGKDPAKMTTEEWMAHERARLGKEQTRRPDGRWGKYI